MRILFGLTLLMCLHMTVARAETPHVAITDQPAADPPHYRSSIRYRIHPRLGWYVPLKHVCNDRDLQERLWRVIRKLPVVTAHQDGTLTLDLDLGTVYKTDQLFFHEDTGKVVGWWKSSTPGITFGIALQEREKLMPSIQVVVKQVNADASWCAAMWDGVTDDKF